MKHLEVLLQEYLAGKQQRTTVVNVSDMQWNKFLHNFINTDLAHSLKVEDEGKKLLALQTVMFLNKQSDFTASAMNEYIMKYSITDEEMENILLYMDMLNSWSLELQNGAVITPYSVPSLVRITQYAFAHDVEDAVMIDLFIVMCIIAMHDAKIPIISRIFSKFVCYNV